MGVQLSGRRTTLIREEILGEELHAWINWRIGLPTVTATYRGVSVNSTRKFSGFNPSRAFKRWPKWARGLHYRDTDSKR